MTSSRIPPLLKPYLSLPPPASLTLLTDVLGATHNWLLVRFLAAALASADGRQWEGAAGATVVLVSFLRNRDFWKLEASRVGLDLHGHEKAGRFVFVDVVEGLFLNASLPQERDQRGLHGPEAVNVEQAVSSAIEDAKRPGQQMREKEAVLIIDGIDMYLAATETGADNLQETIGEWREHAHSTILTVASDFPLMHTRATPLESNHAALLAGLAHSARLVMSVRGLDTGVARDISGVLRIMKRFGWDEGDEESRTLGGKSMGNGEPEEVLYYVGMDGGVKVWERDARA